MDPNLDPAVKDSIKIIIPIIRKILPSLIAQGIIGVQPMDINNYTNWEKWFAWYPVTLRDGTTQVWLRPIYRRYPTNIFSLLMTKPLFTEDDKDTRSFFQRKIANRKNIQWQYDNDFGVLKG